MKIYKKYKSLINKILLIAFTLLLIFIYFKVGTINTIVNIVFIGFIFAYTLNPLRNYISEKFNISKRISSIILIILIVSLVLLTLYIVLPTIFRESLNFGDMLDNIEKYINDLAIKLKINDVSFFQSIYTEINEEVNRYLSGFSSNFLENMMSVLENLVSFAIIPIVTYYFLVDGDLIYNKILLVLPTEKEL